MYGFDYDYTLAHYSSNLQSLIYDLAKEHMVNEVSVGLLIWRCHADAILHHILYYDVLFNAILAVICSLGILRSA